MSIMYIVIVLVVVGFVMWLINNFIPMASSIKSILNAVVVIGVILWLLAAFGIIPNYFNIHLGR